jgi:hypothetical protein
MKMPSVGTYIAQPLTRSFITTADTSNAGPNSKGPQYFLQSDIDAWMSSNASDMRVVGRLVVITGEFGTVLGNLNHTGEFDARKNLTDMGTEYIIGNQINSRIVVLRKVMYNETAGVGALGGLVAYIPVENNATEPNGNWGRFAVRVARA